jgi:hypothetical protein
MFEVRNQLAMTARAPEPSAILSQPVKPIGGRQNLMITFSKVTPASKVIIPSVALSKSSFFRFSGDLQER